MFPSVLWRVEALELPRLARACPRCAHPCLETTHRFRVNAQKKRLDVWLLYRCPGCGAGVKQRVQPRASPRALSAALERYLHDDPSEVRRLAFSLPAAGPVAFRLVGDALPAHGGVAIRVRQPEPCGLRWDRLLAQAFPSRAALRRAWRSGRVRVQGGRLSRTLSDGQWAWIDPIPASDRRAQRAREGDR